MDFILHGSGNTPNNTLKACDDEEIMTAAAPMLNNFMMQYFYRRSHQRLEQIFSGHFLLTFFKTPITKIGG